MGNEISTIANQSTLSKGAVMRRPANIEMDEDDLLIWLDGNINDNNRDFRNTTSHLYCVVDNIGTFSDSDQCIQFIKTINNDKVRMIVSGSLGEHIMPQIHNMSQVNSVFIFCGNKERHEQWAKKWSKIRGVFTEIAPICEALKQVTKQCEQNSISIRFMATNGDTSSKKSDKLHYSFMYTQILKEILLSIKFEQQHIQKFITYCRDIFAGNNRELQNIKKFEREYFDETPIWWYTSECFLYPMLNRGLRTMNVDIIIMMGFFIDDLHRHIEKLHFQQFNGYHTNTTFIVYRGQGLSKNDFDQLKETKGGLMSFNNFLSTSKDRNISLKFARGALLDTDMIGILFVMTINPSQSTTPFASITDVSYYKDKEDEVLFSMHTVFRTHGITPMDENQRLFQVELTLTSDDDKDLRMLTDHIGKETKGSTGWRRLSSLLFKLGKPEKAQEVDAIMPDQTTEQSEKEHLDRLAASAKKTKNEENYDKIIKTDNKALRIPQQSLPSNHSDFDSYNKRATVYYNIEDYSKALIYFEKVLAIQQQSLPSNHPDFAISYNNIGNVYNKMGEYSKSLSYHKKALKIQEQSLPSNHPDLGTSYNNIGMVYRNMRDYSNAFASFERAVDIGQHSLPSNHPHLKEWRRNLEHVGKSNNVFIIV